MTVMTTIWNQDRLSVKVGLTGDGSLTISGYDLKDNNNYEYILTVAAADVPTVFAALPGPPEADLITRLQANAEMFVVNVGEQAWLESLGIKPEFWSDGDWTLFE
jgi:hypothetical protein